MITENGMQFLRDLLKDYTAEHLASEAVGVTADEIRLAVNGGDEVELPGRAWMAISEIIQGYSEE